MLSKTLIYLKFDLDITYLINKQINDKHYNMLHLSRSKVKSTIPQIHYYYALNQKND